MPSIYGKSSKSKGSDFDLLEDSAVQVRWTLQDLLSVNFSKINRNYVDNFQKTFRTNLA